MGGLEFWDFAAACAPPALAGLASVWLVVRWQWRAALVERPVQPGAGASEPVAQPPVARGAMVKALFWTAVLLAGFTTPIPHTTTVLVVAGALLVSRRMATRQLLGLVDWHLLVLFGGLFVVTAALAAGGKEPRAAQDHGWMYSPSFEDLDGHVWEPMYSDLSQLPGA